MKLLKYLFLLILIVVIGAAIYFATKDGSFDVAATKTMEAPPEVIYNQVKDFKDWPEWGPWIAEDPNMQIDYAEKTEGEGASYSWKSEKVGDGSMRTTKVIPAKEIEQEITFNTPMGDSDSDIYWKFEETDSVGKTKVTWGMKGEQSFMEKVYMSFQDEDFETTLKTMFDTGLNNLEEVVEESMEAYSINVDGITEYGGGYYMFVSQASSRNDIGAKMGPMFGQVMQYMQQNNLQQSGQPFAIYNQVNEQSNSVIFSAAIPVKERVVVPPGSSVQNGFMEPVPALKVTLKGNYTNIPEAYEKANAYMAENGLQPNQDRNMFEIYANDPGNVPNPADYLTELYLPVQKPAEPELP